MPRDTRKVVEVLRAELNFVRNGGYARSPNDPWRAQLFLEDSPTCMNYDCKGVAAPCTDCLLSDFVPPGKRLEKIACRHIPLTAEGETLLQLYRGEAQGEIEEAMETWLRKTIDRLESAEKTQTPSDSTKPMPVR
jgi:hypothetical protein